MISIDTIQINRLSHLLQFHLPRIAVLIITIIHIITSLRAVQSTRKDLEAGK